jgi:hypothetical protein
MARTMSTPAAGAPPRSLDTIDIRSVNPFLSLEKIKIEAEEDLTEPKPNNVGTVDLQDRIEGKV